MLSEALATGAHSVGLLHLLNRALRTCHRISIRTTGRTLHLTVAQMYFPSVTRTSAAFSLTTSVTGIEVGFDLVSFRASQYVGYLMYGGIGAPSATTCLGFTKEAVEKAEGKRVTLPPT